MKYKNIIYGLIVLGFADMALGSVVCSSNERQINELNVAVDFQNNKVSIEGRLFYRKSILLNLEDVAFKKLTETTILFEHGAQNLDPSDASQSKFAVRGQILPNGVMQLDLGDYPKRTQSTTILDCREDTSTTP